jgi:hypothetical protein
MKRSSWPHGSLRSGEYRSRHLWQGRPHKERGSVSSVEASAVTWRAWPKRDPAAATKRAIARTSASSSRLRPRSRQRSGVPCSWQSIPAELSLGLLVGLYIEKRTDQDYTSWKELKGVHERIGDIEVGIAAELASIEIAKNNAWLASGAPTL